MPVVAVSLLPPDGEIWLLSLVSMSRGNAKYPYFIPRGSRRKLGGEGGDGGGEEVSSSWQRFRGMLPRPAHLTERTPLLRNGSRGFPRPRLSPHPPPIIFNVSAYFMPRGIAAPHALIYIYILCVCNPRSDAGEFRRVPRCEAPRNGPEVAALRALAIRDK